MWLPGVQGLYEGLGDCFKGVKLLDDLTKILGYINEMLIIIKGYRGGLHPVFLRALVLENIERIEDSVKTFGRCVRGSTVGALYSRFKDLLEGGEVNGWGLLC